MTSKAYRNLSEAELAMVAGGVGMAVIPSVGNQPIGGTRDDSGSDSGSAGGGSNLSDVQEQQPEF
jgi:hypothetical protein